MDRDFFEKEKVNMEGNNHNEKVAFLRLRVVHIMQDIKNNGVLFHYRKTLAQIYNLSKKYEVEPISLCRWEDWKKFCVAYEIFLRSLL